jgi:hypothetical protein
VLKVILPDRETRQLILDPDVGLTGRKSVGIGDALLYITLSASKVNTVYGNEISMP